VVAGPPGAPGNQADPAAFLEIVGQQAAPLAGYAPERNVELRVAIAGQAVKYVARGTSHLSSAPEWPESGSPVEERVSIFYTDAVGHYLTRFSCARNMCDMNVTLSVDDEVILRARRRAEILGTSVNQLVRDYLEQLAGKSDPNEDAAEFERLSKLAHGDSRGWKFNREELHERS
jgi:hypothetical protein